MSKMDMKGGWSFPPELFEPEGGRISVQGY